MALLLSPFVALQLLELFVLPIDFFTFRVWEAALAAPYRYPGSFYPNLHVKKDKEYGDRYRSGDPNVIQAKSVEWFTDAYGWRNRPEIEKRKNYDVVVLGDSNIVGSFLDQKDMLTEVIGARSEKTAYSYSVGHDHISLFFSDSRLQQKSPELLIVESKVGTWNTNNSYLSNFHELPDGALEIVDRSTEFANTYYTLRRNRLIEKIESQLTKQAMFHWLKSELGTDFVIPQSSKSETFIGNPETTSVREAGWRPQKWVVENGVSTPLTSQSQPALTIRATAPNAYWHTERFIVPICGNQIRVRFEAKNSVSPSRHRVWIFEDGSYRSVGELVAGSNWRTFDIPINPNRSSVLEFQIDQPDVWQHFSIRAFQVIGGESLPSAKTDPSIGLPKAVCSTASAPSQTTTGTPAEKSTSSAKPFPRPANLAPIDNSGRALTVAESQYYFYHATKAMERKARERNMDFILFMMPDYNISRLMPAITQLRLEGIKILAYEPHEHWASGVDVDWYWQKADSHWTEAAVRLTADEILRMWRTQATENRPFSQELMAAYGNGFPKNMVADLVAPLD